MSTIKKGKKLTVSTGDGINRTQTQSLGVLEISGKGVSGLTTEYSYDWYNTNDEHKKAQLVIGKTDGADDSTLQLAVDTSGNSIIEALAYNNPNKHILMQVLGGNVGIGTASPFEKLDLGASGGNIRMSGISDGDNAPDRSIGRYDSGNTFKCGITFGNTSDLHDYISFTTHEYNVSSPERMRIDYNGNVGIGTINPRCTMDISATDALIIPVGTEAQRPTNLSNGMIRYNTSTVQFEGYGPGGEWGSLGGIKDVDGDTYIEAETSAGTDNDDLKFFTSGNQRMIIDSSGNVGIGTTTLTSANLNVGRAPTFSLENKLERDVGAYHELFGYSVAISGNYAIVGAPWDLDYPMEYSEEHHTSAWSSLDGGVGNMWGGRAYIYNVQTGQELHELGGLQGGRLGNFGYSVAISDNYAIVGAPSSMEGTAYIYNLHDGTEHQQLEAWSTVLASGGVGIRPGRFGYSVAISDNYAIVGAWNPNGGEQKGTAYIYDVQTGLAHCVLDTNHVADHFGYSVAISDNYAIGGAWGR